MPVEFCALRKRTLLRKGNRVVDFRGNLGIHGNMRGLIDQIVVFEQLAV
jgi:hypothetical protein